MAAVRKVLIANRGVCACRIIKTCRKMGINYVTVFTTEDRQSLHAKESTERYLIDSYMDMDGIIRVAKRSSSDAIFPGYGFQAENPSFPKKCAEAGITFIGPTAENMQVLGHKVMAKKVGKRHTVNLPTAPASDVLTDLENALQWGDAIGYPLLMKPVSGGGGIGIELCDSHEQVRERFSACCTRYLKLFECGDMYLEKFIPKARHIEVQVFGDGKGTVIHLGERECSVQRRNQKLIEESPSLALTQDLRDSVCQMAVRLCASVAYRSAGTVEFLFSEDEQQFYFLEVNTRLQVEHRVTEMRHGIDLVEWMIKQASDTTAIHLGEVSSEPQGHVIECRINTEDCLNNFKPTTGVLSEVKLPESKRDCQVDSWVYQGCSLSSRYDSLLANIIHWAPTREEAIQNMVNTLQTTILSGPPNNLDYLKQFLFTDVFRKGETYLDVLNRFIYKPRCIEVITPGLLTTLQDWPGRQGRGLWRVGVPPSGPMDHLACRIANRLVNNQETDAVLEITQHGPTPKFHCDTSIALTGAAIQSTLNDEPIEMWKRVSVRAGGILKIGKLDSNAGLRAYLSIAGGLDVPNYLGSRSTFPSGNFGGYQGRPLKVGDGIPIGTDHRNADGRNTTKTEVLQGSEQCFSLNGMRNGAGLSSRQCQSFDATPIIAEYSENWFIGVLPGPHANPEYFTDKDMEMLYDTNWQVHHNSNRLGIRLSGPVPEWSRSNGGEGGSHPSNIHDCEYAVGTINFTGNMPIIIAQDGPSLGGFVCPCTITQSELWKIGQVKAGDTIKFRKMTIGEAVQARREQNEFIRTLESPARHPGIKYDQEMYPETKPILHAIAASDVHPGAEIRLAGDSYILVEYGHMVLDLNLRFRVHFLEQKLLKHRVAGLEETAPGVRSLQIRYNPLVLPLMSLLNTVISADGEIKEISSMSIPSRILHLPMCFDYSGVDKAIYTYMKSVRPHAPYLPSNITYVAQNNGLGGWEDVRKKVFSASYMCVGLGDVYLGACCAVPVNPLHRLVTSKYNPARTFTQEGTVGLGGSYMCIYPMNSPGGYQLVGRTLPIWDTFGQSNQRLFSQEKPWMLKMFDQIRFYSVAEQELDEMRLKFRSGDLELRVESEIFSIKEYNRFVSSIEGELKDYRQTQREAARVMLREEEKSLEMLQVECEEHGLSQRCYVSKSSLTLDGVPEGYKGVCSPVTGKVWEIIVSVSEGVHQGQAVASVEAMKMECACTSPCSGIVSRIMVEVGEFVHQGDLILIIEIC